MNRAMYKWISCHRQLTVVLMDIGIMSGVSAVLFFININHGFAGQSFLSFCPKLLLCLACVGLFQLVFRTYKSLWRYAGSQEYLRLTQGMLCGAVLYQLLSPLLFPAATRQLYMIAVMSTSLLLMLAARFISRWYFQRRPITAKAPDDRRELIILGAGDAGVAVQEEIMRNPACAYRVWAFLDDDPAKIGHQIHGVKVKAPINSLPQIIKNSSCDDVILAIPSLSPARRQEIVQLCRGLHCQLRILPDTLLVMDRGNLAYSATLREIRIEDLLSRTSVDFERNGLDAFLRGRTVLVTGAGGSIGSELSRQIASCQPAALVLLDALENNVYELREELKRLFPGEQHVFIEIASIRDPQRLEYIFKKYHPELVFHAAAHKHVPLMENSPEEAVKNNIFGAYNLMTLAAKYACAKFVQISTDKAVNPTNVMGATKRFCEMMIQAMADQPGPTDFVAVRFGNVLGSSGSVIPLFQAQIENGGPVTITDRRITRYFMTIPEAASLVLQAGRMARRSEIYVLDMGQPVRIIELAEKMIVLAGYQPYTDIPISEIGLRPGEKLYEEPLISKERHTATSNSKIFIEKQSQPCSMADINQYLHQLHAAVDNGDQKTLVKTLKNVVPTFRAPEEINNAAQEWQNSRDERRLRQILENSDAAGNAAYQSVS